ncbi:MAG: CoB--CoM heterodisulfide reductase iron-sulfur subunit B family protein [Deltaproteobacteria bacterium]|nr:CoB--CoM heterodisulfide reductase iron-sulfur subunit B family protein [Deltaproteobacteria bacterium]
MEVSYYPGCSLEETAAAFDQSVRGVCSHLEVALTEIPDWSCCGSSPALKMDRLLSSSLAAHNLALAQAQQPAEVVVPCPFCFRRLLSAQQETRTDPRTRQAVLDVLGVEPNQDLKISNLLGFLRYDVGLQAIGARVQKPLSGLKVLTYYGCYLVKPAAVTQFDDPENPVSMDQLLTVLGAEVLSWDFKTECCGASLAVSKTATVCELSGRLLREAVYRQADALAVACQLCQANLDLRQAQIGKMHGTSYHLPILYFTQLMGLAFGLSYRDLGLPRHLTSPAALLKAKGVIP